MTIHHRLARHALVLLLLLASLAASTPAPVAAERCAVMRTTGYVRTEFSPWTADGTSIYTDEPIVAASWDIPLGSYVVIPDLGVFRVADRGLLGSSGWIDIAVWTRQEAYRLTGWRTVCVYLPGEEIG